MIKSGEALLCAMEEMAQYGISFSDSAINAFAEGLLARSVTGEKLDIPLALSMLPQEAAESVSAAIGSEDTVIDPVTTAKDCVAAIAREAMDERIKELADRLSKDYDYIFFDAPAGLSDGFELACAASDRGIVVSTADAVCVRSVNITAGAMRSLGIEDIRLVINRFDEKAVCKKKLLNIDDVIDAVCVQLIGIVPEDAAVSHCAVSGEPLPASSTAAKAFSRIATRIDGGVSPLLG